MMYSTFWVLFEPCRRWDGGGTYSAMILGAVRFAFSRIDSIGPGTGGSESWAGFFFF